MNRATSSDDDDEAGARAYAKMQESRRSSGIPFNVEDGMIAAVCSAHGAALAIRSAKESMALGLDLIDPCNAQA